MNEHKARTVDGERTRLQELNTGTTSGETEVMPERAGIIARWRRFYRNLNLVLAGMYTGLTCHGTPHTHHTYSRQKGDEASAPAKKSDNRPI